MAAVAAAGPASNLIMAFISIVLMRAAGVGFGMYLATHNDATISLISQIIVIFFSVCASININLAVFNLLPIPPLDGSRLISVILPDKVYFSIMK
jgi:Zn-dependent protease